MGTAVNAPRRIVIEPVTRVEGHGKVSLLLPPRKPWRSLQPAQLDLLEAIAAGGDWDAVISRLDTDDVALTQTAIELHKLGVIDY